MVLIRLGHVVTQLGFARGFGNLEVLPYLDRKYIQVVPDLGRGNVFGTFFCLCFLQVLIVYGQSPSVGSGIAASVLSPSLRCLP